MAVTRHSLLVRVRDTSDQESWQEFFELYSPLLGNFVRARGITSPTNVDDVVQELMINLVRRLPEFEFDQNIGKFRTYLWQSANHAVANWYRKNANHERAISFHNQSRIELSEQAANNEPDEVFISQLKTRILQQVLAVVQKSTNIETWQCFELHILDRLPAKEVSLRLNRTVNSIYINAARVMQKVRQKCADYMDSLEDPGGTEISDGLTSMADLNSS